MNELTDEQITSIAYDCNALPEVVTDETLAIFACAVIAADRALQNNAWRKAIDDARLSLMLDITAPDANPAECVKELVSWANDLALNPAISSDAQALIDRGIAQQAERHAEELLAYEVTVGNLRAQREQAQPVAIVDDCDTGCFVEILPDVNVRMGDKLYLHPAAPQAQPEHKPMTNDQITKLLDRVRMQWVSSPPTYEVAPAFARAVEAFHGIKETP